ncbi:trypsin-like peptidase domain-containing protein [Chondromyces crocatus]|uniref:Serine protease n=1 Tax=Chondromyces crocatus TaxID=52 RepID=A0A0K1ET38_CHOCO|nr:trypsin-like peptidase domain-containing protein [Chondromyces crocatus]AKT43969.1 serine protease [Chondromyces crocatus]
MTNALVTSSHSELAIMQEHLARTQRAVVTLRADSRRAVGWIALLNGAVLTSRSAIGYPAEIAIEREDGLPVAGRVVSVDVTRDVTIVVPLEVTNLGAPLPLRGAPDARLGEPLTAVSTSPGHGLQLTSTRIARLHHGRGPGFDIDPPAPLGAALLDADGRVVGMVTAAPGKSAEANATGTSALPASTLGTLLDALDRPLTELRDRAPIYRCPACDDPYDIGADRCGTCGRALPHAFTPSLGRASAERLVRDGLASIGVTANRVRTGPTSWRFPLRPFSTAEACHLELTLDEEGQQFVIRSPLVALPTANHEPFYRFLLTMNDQTTGDLAVSITGDHVAIGSAERVEGCVPDTLASRIQDVARAADEYRRTLAETFEAAPRYEPGL